MLRSMEVEALKAIERRVLWLATNMIETANHIRPNSDGLKVGGHQASCASMVSLMVALYLHHLDPEDFVAVKPHGGPVLHALNFLMGHLTPEDLESLRAFGGIQAYPSRTKDPGGVDFSTGSVGLGPTATLYAATVRNYVDSHFGPRAPSRFIAVIGDAELDEGNVWEAVHDPASKALGNVTWIIDFNRQSLDRIVPDMRISPWHGAFAAHGWQVIELKYGQRLRSFVEHNDGQALLDWIDGMPNERYQALFGLSPARLRSAFLLDAPAEVDRLLQDLTDQDFADLVTDLGGHDIPSIVEALEEADADQERPTAIFAYTHKGWGLPIQGNARNHAAVLSSDQVATLRDTSGISVAEPWAGFDGVSPEGRLLARRSSHLRRPPHSKRVRPQVPTTTSPRVSRPTSTQEAFGRILVDLSRDEQLRPYIVTASPDVATSTNLAGWINRVGVFAETERPTYSDDPALKWLESPTGQHIELGISEMNLFSLLTQLGLSESFSHQRLLPVGTLYDPFVCRVLDALIYGLYSGSSFVFAGTPSGVTLAPEGGAHQSTITCSIGTELPGLDYHEPAFVKALDWLLCDSLSKVASSDDHHAASAYFRLTTRQLDQRPFEEVIEGEGEEILRSRVLAGAYRLHRWEASPDLRVTLAGCGAIIPEVLAAGAELADEGISVDIVDITSPSRLYATWRASQLSAISTARTPRTPRLYADLFTGAPLVTVQDGASHHLAWLSGAIGTRGTSLGVDAFGQSGSVQSLYRAHHIDAGSIVNAALGVLPL